MRYTEICRALVEAGIEDAGREAALLISHFCRVDESEILADTGRDYDSGLLKNAVARRVGRYPLQYILGEWYFYRETYEVSPDCLIPRPETELLVETAAKLLPEGATFVDLCTGSGCIAISLLAARPDCRAVAVDAFEKTLATARRNAVKNKVSDRVEFVLCDVLSPDAAVKICRGKQFSAILSNPPYIKSADIPGLDPELASEPRAALDGGESGLDFYRAIIPGFTKSLAAGGFMLFEAGIDTAQPVAGLGRESDFESKVISDYSGLDRLVLLSSGGSENNFGRLI